MSWFGWRGRILVLDLHNQSVRVESRGMPFYQRVIGGRGLAGMLLYEALHEESDTPGPLVVATGPLTGTPAPASSRFTLMGRSPLTGTVGDASVGGELGVYLKRAGFDAVLIKGTSPIPLGIHVYEGGALFERASSLLEKPTSQLFDALAHRPTLLVTGPSAENGVRFAGAVCDRIHFAGRNGLGALMGSKNLKYISAQGDQEIPIYNPRLVEQAREELFRLTAASPFLLGDLGIHNYGTGALYDLVHLRRMMPTKNFSRTHFPPAPKMNAAAYKRRYRPTQTGCSGCHIQCLFTSKGPGGVRVMPGFETMSHFSALQGNEDLDLVVEAGHLCGELGLEPISMGATLASYLEITKMPPRGILQLIHDTARKRGEGALLALGAQRMAEHMGIPEHAMTVKGMELPPLDPRGAYGMALAYATATRGGCHLSAFPISHEILRKPVATDRFSFSLKARIIKLAEDLNGVVDSLTICRLLPLAVSIEELSQLFRGVTGVDHDANELMVCGERTVYLERIMNAHFGFNRRHDTLPDRFFQEEGSSGEGITVAPLDRRAFEEALSRYYRVRGLTQQGLPTAQTAKGLGLPWNDS